MRMEIVSLFSGLQFSPVGPFLVAPLPKGKSDQIPVGKYGMEEVSRGKATKPHCHTFPSFYKSRNLNIVCGDETFTLPSDAVTLVLQHIPHSWVPKGQHSGKVGSVDHRHRKQVVA